MSEHRFRGVGVIEPAPGHNDANATKPRSMPGKLSRELSGDLPCVRCGYNLKGLTVRGMCPECGVSVRTTLLAVVDPRAKEFQRVEFPRATAAGVTLWSWTGFAACVIGGALQAAYVLRPEGRAFVQAMQWAEWTMIVCVAASGVGALALVRPHPGLPLRWRFMAVLGVLGYVPLVWAVHELAMGWGPMMGGAFSSGTMEAHVPTQLIAAAGGVLILMGLRPNAQALQSRWLLMRIGAVTRQTMLAMMGVVLLWILGDLLVLIAARMHGGADEVLRMVAKLLMLVSGIFLTVGMGSISLDCWRIRGVVLRPPLSMDEVLGRVVPRAMPNGETGTGRSPNTVASSPGEGGS